MTHLWPGNPCRTVILPVSRAGWTRLSTDRSRSDVPSYSRPRVVAPRWELGTQFANQVPLLAAVRRHSPAAMAVWGMLPLLSLASHRPYSPCPPYHFYPPYHSYPLSRVSPLSLPCPLSLLSLSSLYALLSPGHRTQNLGHETSWFSERNKKQLPWERQLQLPHCSELTLTAMATGWEFLWSCAGKKTLQ